MPPRRFPVPGPACRHIACVLVLAGATLKRTIGCGLAVAFLLAAAVAAAQETYILDWQSLGACCRPESQHPFSMGGRSVATLRIDADATAASAPGVVVYDLSFEHDGVVYGGVVGSPEFRDVLAVPAPAPIPCARGCVSRLVLTSTGFVVTYVAGSPHGAIVEFTGRGTRTTPDGAAR